MNTDEQLWVWLDGVLAAWPAAVALFDRELRVVRANPTMTALNGGRDLIGQPLDEALGEPATAIVDHLRAVLATGEAVLGQPISIGQNEDVDSHLGDYHPIRDRRGEVIGIVAAVLDVDVVGELSRARDQAVNRAELTRQALAALQATTVAIAEASSIASVVDVVLGVGLRAARADAGTVAFLDPVDGLVRVVAATGYDEAGARLPTELPLDAAIPLVHTIRTGEVVFGSVHGELRSRFADLAELAAELPHAATATLPLRSGSEIIGALALSFDDVQAFDDEQITTLVTMADLSAAALVRVRLLEEEERARAAAAAAAERNAFLAEATAVVSAPLDERRVLHRLARLCVPRLGDWCSITRPGDGVLERVIVFHHDASLEPLARRLQSSVIPLDSESPAAVTFRTGRTQLLTDIDRSTGAGAGSELPELLRRLGSAHGIVVPIGPRSRPLGVLAFAVRSPRVLTEDDVALAAEIALRAGIAVEHAESFARERDAAASLQRAILPAALPEVPGVDVAATYLPSGSGRTVGGDWFDAFELGPDRLGLAVGDVAGHGITAAAAMAQLRHALRAYLVEGHPPGEALSRLNRLLASEHGHQHATVVTAVLEVSSGRMVVANAGHLPPLLAARGRGCVLAEAAHGPMLGAVPHAAYPEQRLHLEPGDAVLLFTDGLVERRGSTLDDTMGVLCREVESAPPTTGGLQSWCDELVRSRLVDRSHDDDSCALIVRRAEAPLRLALSPEPAAARLVRSELVSRYGGHPRLAELQLCATELVTNGLIHACPPLVLVVEDHPRVVRVELHDASPARPSRHSPDPASLRGRGLQLLDALALRWGVESSGDGKVVWFEFRR